MGCARRRASVEPPLASARASYTFPVASATSPASHIRLAAHGPRRRAYRPPPRGAGRAEPSCERSSVVASSSSSSSSRAVSVLLLLTLALRCGIGFARVEAEPHDVHDHAARGGASARTRSLEAMQFRRIQISTRSRSILRVFLRKQRPGALLEANELFSAVGGPGAARADALRLELVEAQLLRPSKGRAGRVPHRQKGSRRIREAGASSITARAAMSASSRFN